MTLADCQCSPHSLKSDHEIVERREKDENDTIG